MSELYRAKELARKAHEGQTRKSSTVPYITHPAAVVNYLQSVGITDENVLAAAWLHDVVEDTDLTMDIIRKHFNSIIANYVSVLTKNGDQEEYNSKIKNAEIPVQMIKLADVIHNTETLDSLSVKAIERKIRESVEIYLPMAKGFAQHFIYA